MRRFASILLGLVAAASASPYPQAVTSAIAPAAPAPSGCHASYAGEFGMAIRMKRADSDSTPVACRNNNTLTMTLSNTIMKDDKQRTAYIASNRQFQFDGPPQAGAIYTAGFSVCDDDTIALGGSKTFYQCLSGTFYNLYDQSIGGQCGPVQMRFIKLEDCDEGQGVIGKDV
ncbi:hypothetical protein NA57DRAFT_45450 [Rhizodiscina lignyota]|uniref:Cell wall mannoprotein PIR1-like C-terminal domain-containing protein n=1 Tax=Rhizodiscina lignyota TaxID=1504668 RepID=A0A9P4I4D5_9PEZI|nr:hypothetical protein NA57DRAFT_45450 [Rhizodiscina lignyota]